MKLLLDLAYPPSLQILVLAAIIFLGLLREAEKKVIFFSGQAIKRGWGGGLGCAPKEKNFKEKYIKICSRLRITYILFKMTSKYVY